MLSITKCRKILGKDGAMYTDEEIIVLRDVLYKVAELYVENLERNGPLDGSTSNHLK